jgi:hypothetical protein
VYHHVEALLGEEAIKQAFVPYISMDETMPVREASGKILKIGKVARVSKGIQVNNAPGGLLCEAISDKICPYKSSASSN